MTLSAWVLQLLCSVYSYNEEMLSKATMHTASESCRNSFTAVCKLQRLWPPYKSLKCNINLANEFGSPLSSLWSGGPDQLMRGERERTPLHQLINVHWPLIDLGIFKTWTRFVRPENGVLNFVSLQSAYWPTVMSQDLNSVVEWTFQIHTVATLYLC